MPALRWLAERGAPVGYFNPELWFAHYLASADIKAWLRGFEQRVRPEMQPACWGEAAAGARALVLYQLSGWHEESGCWFP